MIELNKQQTEAVNQVNGPVVVISVPGSGKTSLLTERTANLISLGIDPKNILCLTFTNKAAKEMKSRISERLGNENLKTFIGTFHSLCVNILRKYGKSIGYDKNFNILDDKDQKSMIEKIVRQLGKSPKKDNINIDYLCSTINTQRELLKTHMEIKDVLDNPFYEDVVDEYFKQIKENNLIDFSGLLYETVNLLNVDEVCLKELQENFKYIQVDEFQDSNFSQYELINLIADKHSNIMLVGDISQCVTKGTLIETKEGQVLIETLKEGDFIKSASGNGRIDYCKVSKVRETGKKIQLIYKIKTQNGKELSCTQNHILFADFKKESPLKYVVYLMYKEGLGYRVGTSKLYKNNSNHGRSGFAQRCLGESADKVWVLRTEDTEKESRFYEQLYSSRYGLPTWTFNAHVKGNNLYAKKEIDKLFNSLDTEKSAKKLFFDLNIDESFPHYVPKCMDSRRKRNFSIVMCGDSRIRPLHCYSISGSDNKELKALQEVGLKTRPAKNGKGWRVESSCSDFYKIVEIQQKVNQVVPINIIEKARLTNRSLSMIPASNLLVGMRIFVCNEDSIVEENIVEISKEYVETEVYDLDVDRCHNYISNNIVSHNSVYRFRGARYQNILDFMNKHPNCKKITLGKNYRSTPEIIKKADSLIKHNSSHIADFFETDNPSGENPKISTHWSPKEEAEYICQRIWYYIKELGWDFHDIVVLYRLNKLSLELQTAFAKNHIPFVTIGGPSFFDRKEIKDAFAMLRFVSNPNDNLAFHRVAGLFDGMGDTSIGMIENQSKKHNISLLQVCKTIKDFTNRRQLIQAAEKMSNIFQSIKTNDPSAALSYCFKEMDYFDHLKKNEKKNNEAKERIENLIELVSNAEDYYKNNSKPSIDKYLQNMTLVSSQDNEGKSDYVSLMTMHACKGLEFSIVFMVGVEQGVLPHKWPIEEAKNQGSEAIKEAIEEERRICYVGMTRAKKHLEINYCKNRSERSQYGIKLIPSTPSQFIKEAGFKI